MGSQAVARASARPATRIGGTDGDLSSDYRAGLRHLVAFFRSRGVGADEAADLANETVLRTLLHLNRHGQRRPDLGPLTRTIARNLLVERARRHSPAVVALTSEIDVPDPAATDPEEHVLAAERREAVHAALSSLLPRHRKAVELWMQGQGPADIARTLGIKRNAADAILHRARRALASRLGPKALWGVVGLALWRARATLRQGGHTLASYNPQAVSALPAGVSLATVGLAAVLSLVQAEAQADRSVAGPSPTHASSAGAGTAAVEEQAVEASASGSKVAAPERASVTYETGAETSVKHPVTGESEETGVTVSYDPDENGRGPVDEVLEPVMGAVTGR